MKKNIKIQSIALTGAMIISFFTIVSNSYAGDTEATELTSNEIVNQINEVIDISDRKEKMEDSENEIIVDTIEDKVIIEKDEPEIINIESSDTGDFSIELPSDQPEQIAVVEDDTLIIENEDYFVTTEVDNSFIRNSFVIESEEAPEEYMVKFNLPENTHLRYAESDDGKTDGSIEAYTENGEVTIAINPPYAFDASGKKIETFYQLDGDTITQVVKHKDLKNIEYPIVADPSVNFGDWFNGSEWVKRGNLWSLFLYPRLRTRISFATPNNAIANAAWSSIYNKHIGKGHWPNRRDVNESMRKQFHCHFRFAFWKSSFNIEPQRPNVGWDRMIKAKCNP